MLTYTLHGCQNLTTSKKAVLKAYLRVFSMDTLTSACVPLVECRLWGNAARPRLGRQGRMEGRVSDIKVALDPSNRQGGHGQLGKLEI